MSALPQSSDPSTWPTKHQLAREEVEAVEDALWNGWTTLKEQDLQRLLDREASARAILALTEDELVPPF